MKGGLLLNCCRQTDRGQTEAPGWLSLGTHLSELLVVCESGRGLFSLTCSFELRQNFFWLFSCYFTSRCQLSFKQEVPQHHLLRWTFSKHLICILICKQDLDTCVKSGLQYICFQSENNSWSPQDKFYWHFTEGHHEVHKMWASWCELPFVNCLNNCGMDCHDIWSGQELSRYINIDDNCDVCYNKQMIILCKLCSTS